MKKIKKIIFLFFLLVCAALLFSSIFEDGLKKEELRECALWSKWAQERPGVFYLTPGQKRQCDALGIKINAPVKGGRR
jgi:hypothetical protein